MSTKIRSNRPGYRLDCRYFVGEKPCRFKRTCDGCNHYSCMGTKILLIKVGAMGDVLRTTPLLYGLREKYPVSHITWVTGRESEELLENNSLIDRLITIGSEDERFQVETFDIIICLDKDPGATALATLAHAPRKFGLLMDPATGNLCPANELADYMFRLGIDDELKFEKNRKTYQEIVFEALGLPYHRQEYIYHMKEEEKQFAGQFMERQGLDSGKKIVGLNTGAGPVFATKRWPKENFAKLAEILIKKHGYSVVLFGGPQELERNQWIIENGPCQIIDAGCSNTLRRFAALIDTCDVLVSSDTIAMHLGIALRKKVVALFGPTCEQEVDLYDRGLKLVGKAECAPCYRNTCNENPTCMDSLSVDQVATAIVGMVEE